MSIGIVLAALIAPAEASLPSVDEPLRTGARSPSDAAVVIGLEDYAFIADVPYAKRDAQAVYDFLVYTRGVPASQVRMLTSGGREQILDAVERAVGQLGDDGTLWVYFAGHGAASASDGGRLLLGDDVRQDPAAFDARAVPVQQIKDLARGARLALLVDSCYNGLGRAGQELVAGKRFAVPTYAKQAASGILEWTAAGPDQMSGPLEPVQHGAFTYFMIGALRGWADGHLDGNPDGKVTAEEAKLYVQRALRTVQIHDQTPELVADAPNEWVLTTGKLEAAPELSAPSAKASAPRPTPGGSSGGGLDARNGEQMTELIQGIVDQCAAQNIGGDVHAEEWMVRFKVKRSKAKGININDAGLMKRMMDGEEVTLDPYRGARGRCIRREVKGLSFVDGEGLVVSRTLRITREGSRRR